MNGDVSVMEVINAALNAGMLILGARILRHVSHMEFKVDMMWEEFRKRFGDDTSKVKK